MADQTTSVMACECAYALAAPGGTGQAAGDAEASLDAERLTLHPRLGEPLSIAYREILAATPGDYALELRLSSGEILSLSRLGYQFEDFTRGLVRLRNEQVLSDMLMGERVVDAGARGRYSWTTDGESRSGACEARV